jgi:predicted signal transduction protein with EAL and GGDEF domain
VRVYLCLTKQHDLRLVVLAALQSLATLRQLKALGVRIAMDDFGSGYSSLSYLQRFPFDKIKIDRSFIQAMRDTTESVAIVRAVTGLGRGLKIPVIAEGVETVEQMDLLRREQCNEIQAYLIGEPIPLTSNADILAALEAAQAMLDAAVARRPQPASCSRRRGSSSAKLQGRWRMSSWVARISSQPSLQAPGEPGRANR